MTQSAPQAEDRPEASHSPRDTAGAAQPPLPGRSLFTRASEIAWRTLIILCCVILIGWMFRTLRVVVMPLVVGVLLAATIRPVVRWLDDRRVPQVLAVLLPMAALTALLAGAVIVVTMSIQSESAVIEKSADVAMQFGRDLIAELQSATNNDIFASALSALDSAKSHLPNLAATVVVQILSASALFLLSVVFCFFFLLDLRRLQEGLRRRMSEESYRKASEVASRAWCRLEAYLRGLAITASANSLMFGAGLWIIGVPLVLANMLLVFIGSFIPYVGPIVATAVASTLALGSGGLTDALLVVGLGAVVQAIEGNILQPLVVGRAVSLSPLLTVAAVTTGGALAGLIGALVAVPVAAVAILVFDAVQAHRRESTDPAAAA